MVQIIVGGSQSLWIWLGPVLLTGASLIASLVAFLGIRRSNKTNLAAITAADNRAVEDRTATRQREFNNWRRDALLRAALDATTAAMDGHREFSDLPKQLRKRHGIKVIALGPEDPMTPINEAMRSIEGAAYAIGLIGARNAASQCIQIREAMKDKEIVTLANDIANGGPNDAQARYDKKLDRITWYANQFGVAVDEELRNTAPDMAELPPLPNITQWEGHERPPS